jgi:nucleoid-associated protein YgaU
MFGKILTVALVAVLGWGVLARTSDGSGGRHVYFVRPGDSLWSIAAAHYGGDPRAGVYRLGHSNHLASDVLHPGQRLIVP